MRHSTFYSISLSLERIRYSYIIYSIITTIFFLSLIIPSITIGNMIYIFEKSKSEFLNPENKYYIDWSSRILSKKEINELCNEIDCVKLFIMVESNVEYQDKKLGILAISDDIEDFINFLNVKGNGHFMNDEILVNEKFAKNNNLKLYDYIFLNGLRFKIAGIYKSNSLLDCMIKYDQLSLLSTETSIQQQVLISAKDNKRNFTPFFEAFLRKNNIIYSIYNKSNLKDLIIQRKKNWRNVNFRNLLIVTILLIFGLINIFLIIKSKIFDDDKNYAIMKCLGATNKDISITFMADTIICFSIANILLLIFFPGIIKIFKLNEYIDWSLKSIASVVIISLSLSIGVGYVFLLNIHKRTLSDVLKGEK